MKSPIRLHVAAAVLRRGNGDVLIARRPERVHQGGLWEFPGGKIETGENVRDALARELEEELGIAVLSARPLIRVLHDYPDKSVLLDVWQVEAWRGAPHGREGQPVAWVSPSKLAGYAFPAANQPIIRAAQLPDLYLITPDPGEHASAFLQALDDSLKAHGISLVQLRARKLQGRPLRALAQDALSVCRSHGARMLINGEPELAKTIQADGVHLTSAGLLRCTERPLPTGYWVAASCHSRREVEHAARIGMDFVVVSPVRRTLSHPEAASLEWAGLQALCERAEMPVFALGGLGPGDRRQAWRNGAQGIAAIRALWARDIE